MFSHEIVEFLRGCILFIYFLRLSVNCAMLPMTNARLTRKDRAEADDTSDREFLNAKCFWETSRDFLRNRKFLIHLTFQFIEFQSKSKENPVDVFQTVKRLGLFQTHPHVSIFHWTGSFCCWRQAVQGINKRAKCNLNKCRTRDLTSTCFRYNWSWKPFGIPLKKKRNSLTVNSKSVGINLTKVLFW